MAIIYTYPSATPTLKDKVIGSQIDPITEENRTVQFGVGQLATLSTQNYYETTILLTSAQILALNTTAVTLLPAIGASQCYKLLDVSTYLNYGTATYNSGGADINITNASDNMCTIKNSSYVDVAADTVGSHQVLTSVCELGGKIEAEISQAITTGDGSLSIKLRYQILDINNF
tara:strand:- start:5515 stop:6036 length:522 start_codon:yes stop_codon:yes gene_type:complete